MEEQKSVEDYIGDYGVEEPKHKDVPLQEPVEQQQEGWGDLPEPDDDNDFEHLLDQWQESPDNLTPQQLRQLG